MPARQLPPALKKARLPVAVRRAGGDAEARGGSERTAWVLRWVQRRATVVGACCQRQWPVAATTRDGADARGSDGAKAERSRVEASPAEVWVQSGGAVEAWSAAEASDALWPVPETKTGAAKAT